LHESPVFEQVDVADEVARVDVEAFGELVLRERPEIGERSEDRSVR
jgi:hypothetical protein